MRLKLFSLTKTPLWVFFCFLTVVFLLAPVESYAWGWGFGSGGTGSNATTQIPSLGYMDDITNGFNTELQRWGNTFEQAAEALFLMLIPIAMVWRFGQIAMQGGGATEALAELVRFLIFAGFYYELCTKGIYIANLVFTSILDLTTKASGFSTSDSGITGNGYFTPSGIINLGLSVLTVLIKSLHVWSLAVNPSATLFSLICGLIFLILCAIVAVNLLLAYISVWFWMYVGAFILGFGATSWTSDIAIGYFRSVFNASMRAAGMVLVVGVCTHIIHDYVISHQNDWTASLENSACLVVVGLIMYLLSEKIPDQLGSMANGQLGSNHAAVSNSSAYAAGMMAYRLATGGPATAAQTAAQTVARGAASRVAGNAADDVVSRMMPGSSGSGDMGSIKGGGAPTSAAKPAPSASQKASNDDASHYIHGVDFANLKYPNPNAPAPSND